jgi:alkylated DNA repair dioxygenase AlkB
MYLSYGYDTKFGVRYYNSIPFTDEVKTIMNNLNEQFNTEYNVCFLNYYENEKQHLGWHADDSPEMDTNHPAFIISSYIDVL